MVSQLPKSTSSPIVYPEDDGLPMSDNTKQFRWIMTFYYNLEWLFADNPEVFVAGNLLWYPVEGDNKTRLAPDVMVAFGVGKGDRGSYKQWLENNIAPQVVFEILSPGNKPIEMYRKLRFYERHGAEEYYVYDPEDNELSALIRPESTGNDVGQLEMIENVQGFISPRLGIRFELGEEELQLYRPDGEPFAAHLEAQRQLEQEREISRQERERAEQERERAEQERERAEQAEQSAQQERERAERVEATLTEERRKAELLAERLRQMGINPDELE